MTVEKREEGAISTRTYLAYIRAMGTPLLLSALMIMVIVERFLSVVSSVWLAFWSEEHWELSNGDYLWGFAGIGVGQAAVSWARTFAWALASLAAANSLHLALFSATLHTRLAFFDTTPLGRVIQRFTKDTETLDNTLVQSVSSFVSFFLLLLGTIVVMAWVMPVLMPCLVPIGALYYYVQWFFRPGYREAKRLDGISGSPIYAHFGETLNGISTIRAFGHQRRFIAENESRISVNQRADYTQKCGCDRWLPVRLETIGNSITFVVACLGVWQRGSTYAALVGLTLSYAIDMTGLLSWLIRIISELESNMVSVERITEYAALESEEATGAATRGGAKPVRPDWPSAGAIQFRNVQMRYRPGLPLVLRGVSFDVRAGEKVGICGRTGSGKSTLIVALWRLVEPCGGSITLDGVDVQNITLKDLRSRVTCIPQDPILFSGNVRDNLDPFKEHSDETLWFALEAVQLKPAVTEHGVGLLAPVAEYGENFSAGQRQMLCLARALLRDTKVVCLDEATASVDLETDKLMQEVIADQFASRTIMTIAHRINTIIENDAVVCLDRGELVAKATPAEMLRDENSMFAKLVAETGEQSARNLRARAEECEAARAAGVPIRRVGSKSDVA
jgi:ABC-type multidrug transport system fused ATPase/permease subunit